MAHIPGVSYCFDMEEFSSTPRDKLTRETLGCALAVAYHDLTIVSTTTLDIQIQTTHDVSISQNYLHAVCDENCDCGVDGVQLSRMVVGDIFLDANDGTWNANIFILQ